MPALLVALQKLAESNPLRISKDLATDLIVHGSCCIPEEGIGRHRLFTILKWQLRCVG